MSFFFLYQSNLSNGEKNLLISYFYRMIEPTILLNPPLDAEIMTDEIFGPLLPIITVRGKRLFCSLKQIKFRFFF